MVCWQNNLGNEDVRGQGREKGKEKGFTAELYEKCWANRRLVVGTAILGGELAAEGAITGRVSSKIAN